MVGRGNRLITIAFVGTHSSRHLTAAYYHRPKKGKFRPTARRHLNIGACRVPHTFALFANVWEIGKTYEINLSHPTKRRLGGTRPAPTGPSSCSNCAFHLRFDTEPKRSPVPPPYKHQTFSA